MKIEIRNKIIEECDKQGVNAHFYKTDDKKREQRVHFTSQKDNFLSYDLIGKIGRNSRILQLNYYNGKLIEKEKELYNKVFNILHSINKEIDNGKSI